MSIFSKIKYVFQYLGNDIVKVGKGIVYVVESVGKNFVYDVEVVVKQMVVMINDLVYLCI